jgi:hypothetical protein
VGVVGEGLFADFRVITVSNLLGLAAAPAASLSTAGELPDAAPAASDGKTLAPALVSAAPNSVRTAAASPPAASSAAAPLVQQSRAVAHYFEQLAQEWNTKSSLILADAGREGGELELDDELLAPLVARRKR